MSPPVRVFPFPPPQSRQLRLVSPSPVSSSICPVPSFPWSVFPFPSPVLVIRASPPLSPPLFAWFRPDVTPSPVQWFGRLPLPQLWFGLIRASPSLTPSSWASLSPSPLVVLVINSEVFGMLSCFVDISRVVQVDQNLVCCWVWLLKLICQCHTGWWCNVVVVVFVVYLNCFLKEWVYYMDEKCEYGRGVVRYSWLDVKFSGLPNRWCVRELTMLSSPFRLAMIFMVFALKNQNLQAAPQFHLVVFSSPRFSYLQENHDVLSRESHESLRNVTLPQCMSLESHVSEVRWDCSCGNCNSCLWFVVQIVIDICFSYRIHQSSAFCFHQHIHRPTAHYLIGDSLSALFICVF